MKPHTLATNRSVQNLENVEKVVQGHDGKQAFRGAYINFSSVLQVNPTTPHGQMKKSFRSVTSAIYRLGEHARISWAFLRPDAPLHYQSADHVPVLPSHKMIQEYTQAVLTPGSFYIIVCQ